MVTPHYHQDNRNKLFLAESLICICSLSIINHKVDQEKACQEEKGEEGRLELKKSAAVLW